MDQSGYQFLPGLLVAQAGQTVQFRNSEDVLHNVRVTEVATDTPVFNVATLAYGAYDHKFERPGFYTVTFLPDKLRVYRIESPPVLL